MEFIVTNQACDRKMMIFRLAKSKIQVEKGTKVKEITWIRLRIWIVSCLDRRIFQVNNNLIKNQVLKRKLRRESKWALTKNHKIHMRPFMKQELNKNNRFLKNKLENSRLSLPKTIMKLSLITCFTLLIIQSKVMNFQRSLKFRI